MGLHGAFWTRVLLGFMRALPDFLCLALVRPVAFVIYLLAGPQRAAVLENLAALRPEFSPLRRWWGGYEVFREFALTYLDRLWHMHFGREVEWDILNRHIFDEMRERKQGLLVFTIHSGNYDIGASLFARRFGRPLHVVRAPEQTPELQALREAELRQAEAATPDLRVHYNRGDNHLGLELCRVLMAGEVVAVQGDRVITGVSPVQMEHEGRCYLIPRGPLVLAEIARVPCQPIFLERAGRLCYRIHVGEIFYDGAGRLREADLGRLWLPIMDRFVREHWRQWFVFEPLVSLAQRQQEERP